MSLSTMAFVSLTCGRLPLKLHSYDSGVGSKIPGFRKRWGHLVGTRMAMVSSPRLFLAIGTTIALTQANARRSWTWSGSGEDCARFPGKRAVLGAFLCELAQLFEAMR
jgi:hypothetical protein